MDADNKSVKDFAGSLLEMKLETLANIVSISALAAAIVELGINATNAAIGFQMFQNQTGLSSQELQRWQIVAEQANVSAESIATSITSVQRNLAEIRFGRGNISPFQMLGIGSNGNVFDVMRQIRASINKYDPATMTNLISQMGFSPEMMNIFRLSSSEFNRMMASQRGMTEDQAREFLKLKKVVVELGQAFKFAGIDILIHFIMVSEKLWTLVTNLSEGFSKFKGVISELVITFFPLQVMIIGLLLLMDDLAVYFSDNGGKSLTGLIVPGLKKLFNELNNFDIPKNLTQLISMMSTGALPGVGNVVSAGIAGARTLSNTFNISVSGTGNASDIAKEVEKQIKSHFSSSEQQLNNQGH